MNRISLSAAYYSANYQLKRPDLNWAKIKENLGKRLLAYNEWAKQQRAINPLTDIKPLAVSMEATALRIFWVYVQKFKVGQIRNYTVKFCRSYLANSVGVGFKAPHVVTIDRHLERFFQMPNSFLSNKTRATLEIPGQDTNCIALQIDPSILAFQDPKHQENHEKGIELINQPKAPYQKKRYREEQRIITPPHPIRTPQTEEQKAMMNAGKTSASSISDIMKNAFQNFSNGFDTD